MHAPLKTLIVDLANMSCATWLNDVLYSAVVDILYSYMWQSSWHTYYIFSMQLRFWTRYSLCAWAYDLSGIRDQCCDGHAHFRHLISAGCRVLEGFMDDSCDITLESIANETLDVTLESNSELSMDASFSSVELVGQVRECAVAAGRSSTPKKDTCLEIYLSNPLSGKSLI